DPQLSGELEEERVARVAEPAIDGAGTEAAVVPVIEARRAERQVRPRLDPRARGDLVVGERAGAGDELVRRARRVVRLDRVVDQGLVRVRQQRVVVLVADATGEQV